jgi:hypothetical protein
VLVAGQKLGIKEVDDGIWLVSFMHYDLGYFDLEQKALQPLDNSFGTRLSPMSCVRFSCVRFLGTFRYPCVRAGQTVIMVAGDRFHQSPPASLTRSRCLRPRKRWLDR